MTTPAAHRLPSWAWAALLCLLALASPAQAQRVALVVGNAAYADKPLRNPVNDAELMQRTLRSLGFDVALVRNADRRELLAGLRQFEAKARNADVALFYFAGHGTQVAGSNYLLPLKAQIRAESDVPDEAVDANSVLRRIEDAKAKVGLVILDACRDNPYAGSTRSSSRGLGRMSVPTGSIVAYATAPGSVAEDGTGSNGVYTEQLVRQLSTPGLDLREVFDRTAVEVERITGGKQKPREDVGLRGRFVLKEGPGTQVASVVPLPTGQPVQGDPEQETWELTKRRDTAQSYQAYLDAYPSGRYATAARAALQGLQPAPTVPPSAPTAAVPASERFTAIDANGNPIAPGNHACVKDSKTGLLWSTETMGAMSWESAMRAGNGYSRCSHGVGWRLPGIDELKSLVIPKGSPPTTDTTYFPGTKSRAEHTVSDVYWTKDAYKPISDAALIVNFFSGNEIRTNYVRLVRSGE